MDSLGFNVTVSLHTCESFMTELVVSSFIDSDVKPDCASCETESVVLPNVVNESTDYGTYSDVSDSDTRLRNGNERSTWEKLLESYGVDCSGLQSEDFGDLNEIIAGSCSSANYEGSGCPPEHKDSGNRPVRHAWEPQVP
uniref:Uncharacterized protein n=1 Tax=Tetraselmis sp. GSL018 TaxID=582737 RepID=A0A061S9D1_9CHLO